MPPAPPAPVVVDNLFFKRGAPRVQAGGGGGKRVQGGPWVRPGIMLVEETTTDRAAFVAFGFLPEGDVDVDTNFTFVVKSADATVTASPDWAWADGSGFWVVFFPDLSGKFNANDTVNFTVAYTPSGSEEDVTGIVLT